MRKDFCVCNKWLFDTDKRPSKLDIPEEKNPQKKDFLIFCVLFVMMSHLPPVGEHNAESQHGDHKYSADRARDQK